MNYKMVMVIACMLAIGFVLSGCTEQQHSPDDTKQPDDQTPSNVNDFRFPPLDITAPVPKSPVNYEEMKHTLGDIIITYPSHIMSNQLLSLGGDCFIQLENTGSTTQTVYTKPIENIASSSDIPPWNMHFFSFHDTTITLEAGEQQELHYFASLDGEGQFTVDFPFWQASDESDKVSVSVIFYSSNHRPEFPNTAYIYGLVTDASNGKPVVGAEVVGMYYNGREHVWRENTDESGRYVLPAPATVDITSYFADQKLAYNSLGHFVTIQAEGYDYYYIDDIALDREEEYRLDISLQPVEDNVDYAVEWQDSVSEPFGFFWLFVDEDWNKVLATQAKHPPELSMPTSQYVYTINNGDLWSFSTDDECWGGDITSNGEYIALGSHDENLYVVDAETGAQMWSKNCGGMNRKVEFSHDGRMLLSGPVSTGGQRADFGLYTTADGTLEQSFTTDFDWLRSGVFSDDDAYVVVGLAGGFLSMYSTQTGDQIWENYIGEFPLFLAIDDDENIYASGKGRTLFSYNAEGTLRWSYRVPDHTVTSGALSSDGKHLVLGTVGGWVYYLDATTGGVIWRLRLAGEVETIGHNAVSISEDGYNIAIGGGPENYLVVLNTKGTNLFYHSSSLNDDPVLNDKWASIGEGASAGTQKGVMCTVISDDGSQLLAAYGDSTIRYFVKQ